jgi:hypothetical protein
MQCQNFFSRILTLLFLQMKSKFMQSNGLIYYVKHEKKLSLRLIKSLSKSVRPKRQKYRRNERSTSDIFLRNAIIKLQQSFWYRHAAEGTRGSRRCNGSVHFPFQEPWTASHVLRQGLCSHGAVELLVKCAVAPIITIKRFLNYSKPSLSADSESVVSEVHLLLFNAIVFISVDRFLCALVFDYQAFVVPPFAAA